MMTIMKCSSRGQPNVTIVTIVTIVTALVFTIIITLNNIYIHTLTEIRVAVMNRDVWRS